MPRSSFWKRPLSYRETQVCCLIALALHVLPLLLADHFYIDDSWRSEEAGNAWAVEGRVLMQWLYAGLSFSGIAPNLFPLPLLLATTLAALALARLVWHYVEAPTASHVLVVLPLWYNPLFLQNLSYQYDGAGMALALAACIMAIATPVYRWRDALAGTLWVAIACSFYQISLNVFAALCAVEVVRSVIEKGRFEAVVRQVAGRLSQLVGGCLLYYATAYQAMGPARQATLPLDGQWPASILQRLAHVHERIALLATPGTLWLIGLLTAVSGVGLAIAVIQVLRRPTSRMNRLGLLTALIVPVPLIVLLVPGLTLGFAVFNDHARTLMAFGVLMLLVAWLAHRVLIQVHPHLGWLLALPLLAMLAFAFAYGRVMVMQKELQQAVAFGLAKDMTSQPSLAGLSCYRMMNGSSHQWLPAAKGSYAAMPALRYVLNIDFLLLPEMLPRLGVNTFNCSQGLDRVQVLLRSPEPQVDTVFYAIHRVDDVGYVLMKSPRDPEGLRW